MMTQNADRKREQIQMFCMDDLVPQDHLLRLIDQAIDWSFIYDLVIDKYSADNGRPSMDPVMLIKNSIHPVSVRHPKYAPDSKRNRSQCRIPMVPRSGNDGQGSPFLYVWKELYQTL